MRQFRGSAGRRVGGFARDRRGNFAVMFGAVVTVLAVAVGFGVDTVQLFNAKAALRAAVDAAVTSTARDLTTGVIKPADADRMVNAFLSANGNGGLLSADGVVLDSLVVNQTAKTVEATAHVDVALFFPLFGMDKTRRVTNTSAAVYSDRSIEVAMMLDITGSMRKTWTKDKIGDLQAAADFAVEELLKANIDGIKPRVRVAIVPYAEAVNAGKLAGTTVFVEKEGGSNLPPAVDAPVQASASSRPDNCATERKMPDGTADFTDFSPLTTRLNKQNKPYYAKVNRDDRLSVCPQAALIPLTADKQKLLDTIDAFRADGVTAGGIAAQWGYYMLSPNWRPAIRNADLGDGPADYDARKVAKVAILMTDGQFNTAFANVQGTPQMQQGAKAREYAENICANMKTSGISIFTIGFDLPAGEASEARGVLKDCASRDTGSMRHFYEVSTGPELKAAFAEIVRNTERLALTK
jgi:Flp pilus assembly protein TadG